MPAAHFPAQVAEPLQRAPAGRRSALLRLLPALGAVLLVFILLESLLPLGRIVKIGADEDFELTKATLCLKGYQRYTDIWDDQPPLHTFLVTNIVSLFPGSLSQALAL